MRTAAAVGGCYASRGNAQREGIYITGPSKIPSTDTAQSWTAWVIWTAVPPEHSPGSEEGLAAGLGRPDPRLADARLCATALHGLSHAGPGAEFGQEHGR